MKNKKHGKRIKKRKTSIESNFSPKALRLFRHQFLNGPIEFKYRVILEHWINQNGICPLCQYKIYNPLTNCKDMTLDTVPTIDHIIPLSKGGVKNIRLNGRIVHALCNTVRGNVLDEEFNREQHLEKIKGRI